MFGSSALDVTIGLLFIFAVFSLLTSGIQEVIASFLARRSRNLWDNLHELFGESADPEAEALIDVFYRSPFVTQLVTPKRRQKIEAGTLSRTARALRGSGVSVNRSISATPVPERDAARKLARLYGPRSISPASFARAMLEVVGPDGTIDMTMAELRARINTLAVDDAFKRTLGRLLDEAKGDVDGFRVSLEQWYENQMDHVTEWYRRNTRIWLFLIGLVVAGAFNVDTIGAGVDLWNDEELRAAVVADASNTEDFRACQALGGGQAQVDCIQGLVGDSPELPLGYGDGWDADAVASIVRIVGWVITAAAMMAGATFWFDLLRRAIALRHQVTAARTP